LEVELKLFNNNHQHPQLHQLHQLHAQFAHAQLDLLSSLEVQEQVDLQLEQESETLNLLVVTLKEQVLVMPNQLVVLLLGLVLEMPNHKEVLLLEPELVMPNQLVDLPLVQE